MGLHTQTRNGENENNGVSKNPKLDTTYMYIYDPIYTYCLIDLNEIFFLQIFEKNETKLAII